MKPGSQFVVVLVTAPTLRSARTLAKLALQARLIACANLIPGVEAHYWWEGKPTSGHEVLLLLKTRRARLKALEALVIAHHPYDTPEFVVLPLHGGTERYLRWLARECGKK